MLVTALTFAINSNASIKFWSSSDSNFQDQDGDGYMDFNNQVSTWMYQEWGRHISVTTEWFRHFNLDNRYYGLYMPDFIDSSTFRSYCLGVAHYHSTIPLFQRIGQLIIKPTQGFYIIQSLKNPAKRILITEKELKRSWFILKDGKEIIPKEDEVAHERVFFRKSGSVHKLMSAAELKIPRFSTYPAHDHKIGCVFE